MRCEEMQLFFTSSDHGSQGPEFCTPVVLFKNVIMGKYWCCALAVRKCPPPLPPVCATHDPLDAFEGLLHL